jgi:glyoxylase-like metal-dependent hydrolase (beta-lactamase superfamily II)
MRSDGTHIAFFSSGYCTAKTSFVFPGSGAGRTAFHATWALIDHPALGNILFDTGYSRRFYRATRHFPNRIYRWVTPVYHKEEESCLGWLRKMNMAPEDITHVVVSHFHADHVGGLQDFPQAKIWCSRQSLEFSRSRSRHTAVFHGILPQLIPKDLEKRVYFPQDGLEKATMSGLTMWRWSDDVFFVDLPGHFAGQMGLYLTKTNLGPLLLCADAAWSAHAVRDKIYPSKMVSLISHHYKTLISTMNALHHFQQANPDVVLLTSHGLETLQMTHHDFRI